MVTQRLEGGQVDLFGAPPSPGLLPGLSFEQAFLSEAEECALIDHIGNVPLSPFRFQQWTGHRLTHSYGWSYDFQNGAFARAEPIPEWLSLIKERAARFAGLDPDDLVQALVIRYDPGAGIGWHKDRPVFDDVVGISLGIPAVLRFRRRTAEGFSRFLAPLAPRSIYHLSGEARHDWEHSIVAMESTRWSITFRSLQKGKDWR
ncbi:2OG-Fe(II) oxygenase [Sphingobium sp. D43FB]|nr:2OG-Fe(II) oxygenase [Sphingobium sp. D43FB]